MLGGVPCRAQSSAAAKVAVRNAALFLIPSRESPGRIHVLHHLELHPHEAIALATT
jgi:hypothetical protein